MKIIENCIKHDIGVVLAPTIVRGVNEDQIGGIIDFASERVPGIRGVHFQPASYFGRMPVVPTDEDRVTLPEVIEAIERQTQGRVDRDSFCPPGCENIFKKGMSQMQDIFEWIYECLTRKESFVLATFIKKNGSPHREESKKMLIRKDFSIYGTIGGGLVEALTIQLSAKMFQRRGSILEDFSKSHKDVEILERVCGGNTTVLLEYVDCDDVQTVELYQKALMLKKEGAGLFLITKIEKNHRKAGSLSKWICTETGFFGSENEEVQSVIKHIRENGEHVNMQVLLVADETYLIEPYLNDELACIIGAGHVAQKIAELAKMIGLKVVIIDDREEFANKERFNMADEIIVIPSFENLTDHYTVNRNSYVIIVTRGHDYDQDVLSQMLKTDAKYIGMIGSLNKREYVYKNLLDEGFTLKDLERVYAPIGLKIDADTPEEIAISIAAELIKVKRNSGDIK